MLWAWTLAAYAVGTAAGKTDVAATPTKDVSMWVWWCNAQQPTHNWPEFNRLLANQTDRVSSYLSHHDPPLDFTHPTNMMERDPQATRVRCALNARSFS